MKLSITSKILLLILLVVLLFFHSRGLLIHDEGYILNSARYITQGKIIYKDFHFGYTPGSVFLTALSFKLMGLSILSSRILMLILSFLSTILIFIILKKITTRNEYGYIGGAIYVAWGPSHINFAWPIMFVIPVSLLTIYLNLKSLDFPKKNIYTFLLGILCFSAFIFKQNFGILIIPILFSQLLRKTDKYRSFLFVIYGFLWGMIIFTIYLLTSGSFKSFSIDFYDYTVTRILFENSLTTSFFYIYHSVAKTILRNLLYIFPFLLTILSAQLLVHRKKFNLIFIPFFIILFYIFHIRPTTDYVHLVPILSLMGIPLSISMNQYPISYVKLSGYVIAFALIVSGFITSIFYGYYKWDIPLYKNNSYLADNNANIFVNQKNHLEITELKRIINKNTTKDDLIYVDAYQPLLYFLLDRNQPVQNDYPGFVNGIKYQNQTIRSLVAKKPKIILIMNTDPGSEINKFIFEKYMKIDSVGDYKVYKLK